MELSVCRFLIKDKKFLEKHNEIWEKVSNSEPVHNKTYLKADKKNEHKRRLSMCLCSDNID